MIRTDFGDTATRILLFVLDHQEKNGRGPLIPAIVEEVGSARGNVHRHLLALKRYGLVDWDTGKQGTLRATCRRVA